LVKIEFDIPEWAIGRNITIFAGTELLGYTDFVRKKKPLREFYSPLKVKDGRCNGCGTCCETAGSPFSKEQVFNLVLRLDEWTYQDDGKCPLLGENGCILRKQIPFSCARSDCSHFDECTESFIEIEGVE
jgi:hypothetical protein